MHKKFFSIFLHLIKMDLSQKMHEDRMLNTLIESPKAKSTKKPKILQR